MDHYEFTYDNRPLQIIKDDMNMDPNKSQNQLNEKDLMKSFEDSDDEFAFRLISNNKPVGAHMLKEDPPVDKQADQAVAVKSKFCSFGLKFFSYSTTQHYDSKNNQLQV